MVWARSNWKKWVFSIDCSFWICSSTGSSSKLVPSFAIPLFISLARIFLTLIAVLWNRLDERSLGVAIFVGAVGTGQLPVDINHHSCFLRAGPGGIAGKDSLAGRSDHARFACGEEAQRNFYVPFLRLQAERFAGQGVEQTCRPARWRGWSEIRGVSWRASCQPPRIFQIFADHRSPPPNR